MSDSSQSPVRKLIGEIHRRSLWQVLGIYVVASWAVLQVVDTMGGALNLPDWFPSFALALLVIGLPIVLATAFVQEGGPGGGGDDETPPVALEGPPDDALSPPLPSRLLTWKNAILGGVGAFAVVGVIAVGSTLFARDSGISPVTTDDAGLSLAVLPFLVSGSDLEEWKEGMADLVSTGLDGAGGLRSVDTRTVLAQWDRLAGDAPNPDLATSLAVAEAAGARFALEGSVTAIGNEARLVSRVHDLQSGARLGVAQVEGSLDAPQELVDRLSFEILEIFFGGAAEDLPPVNLTGMTTTSTEALKAYLRGQQAHRRGSLLEAIRAFQEAVAFDSTFALAYYQIANANRWNAPAGQAVTEWADEHLEVLADRLPERERLMIPTRRDLVRDEADPAVLRSPVLQAARLYPNDAEVLYRLGDLYLHSPIAVVSGLRVEELLGRAVELDPGFVGYRTHHVEFAFTLHNDSALATRRVAEYRTALGDPDIPARAASFDHHWLQQYERSLRLQYGDDRARASALDSLSAWLEGGHLARVRNSLLGSSHNLQILEAVRREYVRWSRGRPIESEYLRGLGRTLANQGRLADALEILDRPALSQLGNRACLILEYRTIGIAVGEEAVRAAAAGAGNTQGHRRDASCGALLAADLGLRNEFDAGRERLQSLADTSAVAGNAIELLDVYWEWKQGGKTGDELAHSLASVVSPAAAGNWPFWLGEIYREAGRLREAERAYLTAYLFSSRAAQYTMSWYRLAGIYEELGDVTQARYAWGSVLAAWENADPELQPRVEEARARVAALE